MTSMKPLASSWATKKLSVKCPTEADTPRATRNRPTPQVLTYGCSKRKVITNWSLALSLLRSSGITQTT
jgi:hypothetical protein